MLTVEGKKSGFTLVEVLIVFAILIILAAIVLPEWNKEKTSEANKCEEALRLHSLVEADIALLCEIFELTDAKEKTKKVEEFKASEAGKIFFNEFCPALFECQDTLEIQKKYEYPLPSLCAIGTGEDRDMLNNSMMSPARYGR